jgi:UDP-N-acetylglucosamine--N-acetylmuramyl-(pentapeptide) pyrophosphoryl-undecaprenol N-acetylglucosamine transferase
MRVLIVTGSSGGHIFPALALMQGLKGRCSDVLMVMPEKGRSGRFCDGTERVKYIHACSLRLKLNKKNIKEAYFFMLGAWEGLRIILTFKPDVVVGFGSLHTLALLFWAWLFRIKTMIHEQNVVFGKANRLLAKFADKVAVSFAQTSAGSPSLGGKTVVTGNPVRPGMIRVPKKEALDFFGLEEGRFNMLVVGGSQGSHNLNIACPAALQGLRGKDNLQVIHISGGSDPAFLKDVYGRSGIKHRVFDFLRQMQYAYSVADLAVCRAGATTIAELQRFALPAILVPYPFAYAHQVDNAMVLRDCGAALIIREEELCAEKMRAALEGLMADPGKLEAMRGSYAAKDGPDACELLAEEVLNLK